MAERFEPQILGLLCSWCAYGGADTAGISRAQYPPNIRIVRVMCSGRIDPLLVARAFEHGADGVLVAGCHPGDCHYVSGNRFAEERFATFARLLDFFGLDRRRLRLDWVSASEGARFAAIVTEMTDELRALGPLRFGAEGRQASSDDGWVPADARQALPSGHVRPHLPLACAAHTLTPSPAPARGSGETSPPALPAGAAPGRAGACSPSPAVQTRGSGGEGLQTLLRARAGELLASGQVELFLGYRQGSSPLRVAPFAARTPAEADRLVWSAACAPSLAGALRKYADRRVGVALKACDARAVAQLLAHHQLARARLHIVGVACSGMVDPELVAVAAPGPVTGLAEEGDELVVSAGHAPVYLPRSTLLLAKCAACPASAPPVQSGTASPQVVPLPATGEGAGVRAARLRSSQPALYDELLGAAAPDAGGSPGPALNLYDELLGAPAPPPPDAAEQRFAAVRALEALEISERLAFWSAELSKCTLCYACQAACPLCFCKQCAVTLERDNPRRQSREPASIFAFHLMRAQHLAGRCVACDECVRVCPQDLPLDLIYQRLELDRGLR